MRMLSCFSRAQLFVTLWTVARQASLPMGFSRQEYWSGLPFPSPGHLPHPGIEPRSPTSVWQVVSLPQASLVAHLVKNLPALRETWVQSLGWKDTLEKEMATHSSILTWKIPWTQEPGAGYSPWGHRVRHD